MKAIDVLKMYEEWEAKLILSSECWKNGLPMMNQELYEEFLHIQEKRNEALNFENDSKRAQNNFPEIVSDYMTRTYKK